MEVKFTKGLDFPNLPYYIEVNTGKHSQFRRECGENNPRFQFDPHKLRCGAEHTRPLTLAEMKRMASQLFARFNT